MVDNTRGFSSSGIMISLASFLVVLQGCMAFKTLVALPSKLPLGICVKHVKYVDGLGRGEEVTRCRYEPVQFLGIVDQKGKRK